MQLENAPEGATISGMLERGEIDGFIAPRTPKLEHGENPNIGWLFRDPVAAGWDYYAKTKLFPIMHLVGVKRRLAEQHPWLPAAVLKAFETAKKMALERLSDTSASKVTLPFVDELHKMARQKMGSDFWSYGVEPNRSTLDAFLAHHHKEGLSRCRVAVDELFHPGTYETFKL